jgi:hypothetical protein
MFFSVGARGHVQYKVPVRLQDTIDSRQQPGPLSRIERTQIAVDQKRRLVLVFIVQLQ